MMNKRSASDHSEEEEEEGEEGESEEDFEEDMDYYEDYDMDNLDEYYQSELTEKFSNLFSELGNCSEDNQKQKIEEMISTVKEMDKLEIFSILSIEMYEDIDEMIGKMKLPLTNALELLIHMGQCRIFNLVYFTHFGETSLHLKLKKMILDEETKGKEEKNEKLFISICECYLLHYHYLINNNLLVIIVPCLLKVALNKEGNEETQKEVEMALFALCSINKRQKLKRKLFVNEMSEIIQYHQSHRNLTQLAYQSAWEFMMDRFNDNDNLKDAIADKLHFVSEAARELDELKKRVDWKRKKEENEKRRKESKEELILLRWLRTLKSFFFFFQLRNEEFVRIISSIVQVFQAAKDHHREIEELCVCIFEVVVRKRAVKTDDLLKSGTVDAVFEELHRPPLNDEIILNCLGFFLNLSKRLNEIADDEMEEAKRKEVKMELFEKMEENGSEDLIIGLCESQPSFRKLVFDVLSYYL